MIVNIASKEYDVKEAKTDKELEKGLKGVENLPENEGMLFYIKDEPSLVSFTMEDMKIPLDIIFIDQDLEVVDVAKDCKPEQKQIVNTTLNLGYEDFIAYVLEVNANSGIEIGDYLDFGELQPVMKVLNQDGSTQMELFSGERIISRRETKILIKKAKKADSSKKDTDYKALGRYIFKVLKNLDTRDPEYVKSPN